MINKRRTYTTGRIKYALYVSLTFILFCADNIGVMAQSADKVNTSPSEAQDTTVHKVVEQMPEFPGGLGKCMFFLAKHIKYPKEAFNNGEEGRVIVQFVVNRNGRITEEKIVQGVSPSLDAEALRVIKSMPKWKPGTQNGKAVRVLFTLPIAFKLDNKKDTTITQVDSIAIKPEDKAKANEEKVVYLVEKKPEFPGGMNTFMKWFAKNMKYPEIAQKEKIQGKVIVSFIVEKDGSITNAEVKQSVSPALDAEALRIINTMPAWIPGKVRGKAVRSYYSLPVMFNLQ